MPAEPDERILADEVELFDMAAQEEFRALMERRDDSEFAPPDPESEDARRAEADIAVVALRRAAALILARRGWVPKNEEAK